MGERDLWDPDETRYAVVAREMRENGNWILPHLNGAIYAEKPPLFFWLVNVSVLFLGEDSELTNRLPSALAGLGIILLTFFFGEKLFNLRVGFLSGLVLATCFLFPQISRWMIMDSLFTLFFLLSIFYFYEGFNTEERRRRYFLVAGLFIGLGVLTKGPIAYLVLPIFVIFGFLQKEIKRFWNRDLLLGFILSLVVVFIWLIPACWLGGGDYTNRILFEQAIGRLAGSGKHFHPKSIFFYFIRFPIEFLPWTIFLPSAILFGLRRGENKELLFLFIWFIFILFFFTLSKGKKDNYILPLYPSATLMVGRIWDFGIWSEGIKKGFILELIILASLSSSAFILFLFGIPQILFSDLMAYQSLSYSILSCLLVGVIFSLFFFTRNNRWSSFMSLVITFTVFHLLLSYSLPSKLNPQRSMKAFSEKTLKRMGMEEELKTCFFQSEGLHYYTKKRFIEKIVNRDRFFEVLRSSQPMFMVIQRGDLEQLKRESRIEIEPIEQERVGHWNLVLISNQ